MFFRAGEWNQFLYVSKIAFGGWALHYREHLSRSCLPRATLTNRFCSPLPHHGALASTLRQRLLTHSTQGRVTYLHHYLPTLWFAVIMAGNLLDHFIFKSRRFTERTKWIAFTLVAGSIVGTFWLFRACAWGIEGPASALVGRRWRKVSWCRLGRFGVGADQLRPCRGGTSWTRVLAFELEFVLGQRSVAVETAGGQDEREVCRTPLSPWFSRDSTRKTLALRVFSL